MSYGELESVLVKQGKLKAALDAASTDQTIISRLAASDPTNKDWQHGLADADETIGDVLTKEGNPRQALTAYRAGLKIAEALSAADPKNAEWRQSLADLKEKTDATTGQLGN